MPDESSATGNTPPPLPPSESPPRHGSEERHWLVILVVIVVICLLGFLVYRIVTGRAKPAPPQPPTRVSVTNATKGDIGVYVAALGSVVPVATVTAVSQVTGQLSNVDFVEGEIVTNGQHLAQIDARPFQATLDNAQGLLERDQALLAQARMDMERYKSASNGIPRQQYEDQIALVHQYEGTVKSDQGQVSNAAVQLGFCTIKSPVNGRVGLRLVDPGNVILASSTNGIALLTQTEPITIIFSVAEDYLPQIQHQLSISNRMTVTAYDRAAETNLGSGNVMALDSQIDNNTGTIRLRSIFPNTDNALFPNQFVNVQLLLDTLREKTLIPSYAIQRNGQEAFVYVVKTNDTVEMRSIKTDATDGTITAVDGLQPGETIVTDNFNRLQDGAKISVRTGQEGGGNKPGADTNAISGAGKDKKSGGSQKRKHGATNQPKEQ
jgi:multidrug efflux system membrane fusion protein